MHAHIAARKHSCTSFFFFIPLLCMRSIFPIDFALFAGEPHIWRMFSRSKCKLKNVTQSFIAAAAAA